MLGEPPHRKKQKEKRKKKSVTFYITATALSNMIDSVHLSSVEGHPTQAVISDQA